MRKPTLHLTKRTIRRLKTLAKQQGRPCETPEDYVLLFAYVASVSMNLSESQFMNDLVNGTIDAFYERQIPARAS